MLPRQRRNVGTVLQTGGVEVKSGKAYHEHQHVLARYREIQARRGLPVRTLREMNATRAKNAKASRERREAKGVIG